MLGLKEQGLHNSELQASPIINSFPSYKSWANWIISSLGLCSLEIWRFQGEENSLLIHYVAYYIFAVITYPPC